MNPAAAINLPTATANPAVLQKFRAALDALYSDRSERVVLYGSAAQRQLAQLSEEYSHFVSFPRAAWECRFGALRHAPQRGANGFPRGVWEPGQPKARCHG